MILEGAEGGRREYTKEGYQVMSFRKHNVVETPYLHALDGRLRIKVPGVKGSPRMASEVEELLASVEGIDETEANPRTGNVLVLYDSDRLTQSEIIGTLQAAGFFTERHRHHAPSASVNASNDTLAQVVFRASFEFALQRLITALI